MAKKTKRPFKKYLPDESLMPSMPNPGTRGAGGRIIKIRDGFQSVCDWGMTIDYHEAFGSLFRKYWPEIKNGKGSDYHYIYALPQKVSQEIEKAYGIGLDFAKHMYEILGAVNDVIRFTTFKAYINYIQDELTVGDGFYQYDFKIFPKIRKMDENGKIECGAVTHMIVLFEQQNEMRENLIDWVQRAKKTPAYTGKEGRPVRTASKRRRIAKQRTIGADKTDEKAEPTLAGDNNKADGVYGPNIVRFDGKDCDALSPIQIKIFQYMLNRQNAKQSDVCKYAWEDSTVHTQLVHSMLHKMNGKLKTYKIKLSFHLRRGCVEKKSLSNL